MIYVSSISNNLYNYISKITNSITSSISNNIHTYLYVIPVVIIGLVFIQSDLWAADPQTYKELCRGWINTQCSCTHGACWVPSPGEITQLDVNKFVHNPTGQMFSKSGWAKDGLETICAFDPTKWQLDPKYLGPGNKISCYYPVPDKNMF